MRKKKWLMTICQFLTSNVSFLQVKSSKDKNTKEWKYIVDGKTISTGMAIVVGKLSTTGKLVIITAYKI
jgi:hypothetical protein